MQLNLLRLEIQNAGRGVPVSGLHLRPYPYFAAVASKIYHAVQRLQTGVGEVGDFIFGFELFGGFFQGFIRIASAGSHRSRLPG